MYYLNSSDLYTYTYIFIFINCKLNSATRHVCFVSFDRRSQNWRRQRQRRRRSSRFFFCFCFIFSCFCCCLRRCLCFWLISGLWSLLLPLLLLLFRFSLILLCFLWSNFAVHCLAFPCFATLLLPCRSFASLSGCASPSLSFSLPLSLPAMVVATVKVFCSLAHSLSLSKLCAGVAPFFVRCISPQKPLKFKWILLFINLFHKTLFLI